MDDPHEIIITTRDNPNKPRVVQFEELNALRDDILTMSHLWNFGSYYVSVPDRTFIINGGRKYSVGNLGECEFLYRRRCRFDMAMNGNGEPTNKTVMWIMGLQDKETEKMVLLQISEDGRQWLWADSL